MADFSEYKKLGEPDKTAKSEIWEMATGLQKVDGLKTSEYLRDLARKNIEGKLSIYQVQESVRQYYKTPKGRSEFWGSEEADLVSAHISEILSEQTFAFSPAEYISIHGRLFAGILDDKITGKIRDYNIIKDEWVLGGESVSYASANSIATTLEYDFDREKSFDYKELSEREMAEHIAKFVSGIWQIHAFGEGNTRTTAVFIIKYLRTLGFDVNNDPFAKHSDYFRNALVRANYTNIKLGVHATIEYLNKFFYNLLLGEKNMLHNSSLVIIPGKTKEKTAKPKKTKARDTLLMLIAEKPDISIEEMSKKTGLSVGGVRWNIDKLKSDGVIHRVGARKLGHWKILK